MTRVSQRFIDLLNVPQEILREIAEEKQVVGAASMTVWALAEALDGLPRDELEELTDGFLYAGRTSVSFFRIDDAPKKADEAAEEAPAPGPAAKPDEDDTPEDVILEGKPLNEQRVESVLREMSESGDPFNEAARPNRVTRQPQLVFARKRGDGSVLLTFVVEGPPGHVITNFAVVAVVADHFFNAVIYPKSGFVEVRTNQLTAARFGRTWGETFAEKLGLAVYPVSITERDFEALATELDAGTASFRGKNTSGGAVDTVEVRMAPGFPTLIGDEGFESKRAGTEQQQGDLLFNYDGGKEYRIQVSRIRGSIFFIRPAPEPVIDHVREALRRVKVRHRRPGN